MSFVRAGREIETLDAFPRSSRDVSSGLGNWPLLQSYAYHWGIEVKFGPEFDEAFGITNDKQRVRPVEDFWRLLTQEGIDSLLQRENAWQEQTRHLENEKRKTEKAQTSSSPTPAEEAAAAVPVIVGKKITVPDRLKPEAREHVEQEAKKRAAITQQSIEEVKKNLDQEAKRRPFRIDFFDDSHGPFYRPEWMGLQIVVWVNRLHPFYSLCYGELVSLLGGYKAKQALDVLLIALAKAELEIDEETAAQQFRYQREQIWTSFLAIALQSLDGKIQSPDEPEEGNEMTTVAVQATA
jgi:hypothetical protein